jgi:hypothetical protein
MKKSTMEKWQLEDAKRLRTLWDDKKEASEGALSQAEFGAQWSIGSQGMVHQYLAGLAPLNHAAVGKFARGLGVLIDDISPTLADQIRELYGLCDMRKNAEFGVSDETKRFVEQTVLRMMSETRTK